eukprot:1038127-Amphidinium_carterae.1
MAHGLPLQVCGGKEVSETAVANERFWAVCLTNKHERDPKSQHWTIDVLVVTYSAVATDTLWWHLNAE